MSAAFLVLSAFLASAVEMVEALTIVLAAGVTRGWRSSLIGVGAATVVARRRRRRARAGADGRPDRARSGSSSARCCSSSGCSGCARRSCGRAATRRCTTRTRSSRSELAEARGAARDERAGLDWYAFTLSFKGVLLEGLEVAFIVLTFGSTQGSIPLAALGAGAAVVLVAVVGVAVRAPLAACPRTR